jgi:hypothetical protein
LVYETMSILTLSNSVNGGTRSHPLFNNVDTNAFNLLKGREGVTLHAEAMKFQQWDSSQRLCKTFKDDCVVRSISIVCDEPYKATFENLMYLGLEVGSYPNHDKVWQKYLEDKGFVKNKMPRPVGKPRGTIKLQDWDFDGIAAVRNSGHLTAVENGWCIDTWDCRYRPVNSYWTKAR